MTELGGKLLETWRDNEGREHETRGEVLAVEPERRLRCSRQDAGWAAATEVEITVTGVTDGTKIHLRHSGWEALPEGGGCSTLTARAGPCTCRS